MRKSQAQVTEADFQQAVVQFARLHGWRVASFRAVRVQRKDGSIYHETPVGADGKGWPDLFMVRTLVARSITWGTRNETRILAAELKVGRNRATKEQLAWLSALELAGVETFVWRETDWREIERVLQ